MKFKRVLIALAASVVIFLLVITLVYNINLVAFFSKSPTPQLNQQWINEKLVEWQPSAILPLTFAGVLTSASYSNVKYYNLTALYANLNLLYATGAQAIRIDINFDPWLKNDTATINLLDNVVNNIRSHGKLLIIADAAAESYRNNKQSWSQFQTEWVSRVGTLAQRYHPDYYIVVKEPGWYFGEISDFPWNPQVFDANQWTSLTQRLIQTVKSVSPDTKIGVAVPGPMSNDKTSLDTRYMKATISIQGLDFIGFDIYGVLGFTDTLQFLIQNGNGGKNVWIAEAWSIGGKRAFDVSRSSLDVLWIKVLYLFAEKIKAQMVCPFYTDAFASYQNPPQDSASAMYYFQSRTPVFYEFQKIIQSNENRTMPAS